MATKDEIYDLLILASAIDNRVVSYNNPATDAWTSILAGYDIRQLAAALQEHQATSTEYLVPAHLTKIIDAHRRSANLTPQLERTCPAHLGYPLPVGTEFCAFGIRNDQDCLTASPYELMTEQQAIAAGILAAPVLPAVKP